MNCKPGDLAIIRATHPMKRIRGLLVEVKDFLGVIHGENDVWEFVFCGIAQRDDYGRLTHAGLIPDRYLRPISGVPVTDDVTDEVVA